MLIIKSMSNLKLREVIKQIRQCKTAAEERGVVFKESALIRNAFKVSSPLQPKLPRRKNANTATETSLSYYSSICLGIPLNSGKWSA
jgi:hypothetical protein